LLDDLQRIRNRGWVKLKPSTTAGVLADRIVARIGAQMRRAGHQDDEASAA
jgi:hypothetical protein